MKILVTGGAGFIGAHLSKTLIDRGDEVVIIDNFNDYYDPKLKEDRIKTLLGGYDFKLYRGDIRDKQLVNQIFEEEGIDKVVHLAAMAGVRNSILDPGLYADVNINGTIILLEAARKNGVKNFVYASSSSVYGGNEKQPFAEDDRVDNPVSIYAATKKADELIAHVYSNMYGLKTTGLRFFTVYGPWGRPDMALFLFTDGILNNKEIQVFNNGKMERNFTYIDDIVSGIVTILDQDFDYEVMNIGGDRSEKLTDFIETIERHTGKQAKKKMMPMQPGDVPSTVADIIKLRKFGWQPTTQIDEGVKNFVDWYREYFGV